MSGVTSTQVEERVALVVLGEDREVPVEAEIESNGFSGLGIAESPGIDVEIRDGGVIPPVPHVQALKDEARPEIGLGEEAVQVAVVRLPDIADTDVATPVLSIHRGADQCTDQECHRESGGRSYQE